MIAQKAWLQWFPWSLPPTPFLLLLCWLFLQCPPPHHQRSQVSPWWFGLQARPCKTQKGLSRYIFFLTRFWLEQRWLTQWGAGQCAENRFGTKQLPLLHSRFSTLPPVRTEARLLLSLPLLAFLALPGTCRKKLEPVFKNWTCPAWTSTFRASLL